MSSVAEIRAQALEVAAGWSPGDAPSSWRLTAALFRVIAAHDDLLASLARLPSDRLPALLASAAVRFLLRRDRPQPLAAYFPEPGQAQPRFDDGFCPAATAFISDRHDDIMAECARRRYQMNEVARCTQIALGIAANATSRTEPIGLVDLGTGAGLGLQLDRYRYHVGRRAFGARESALRLSCQVRGSHEPPPIDLPPIAERVGIDIAPIDLGDPVATSWLLACAPPEASALSRLAAAIEVTGEHPAQILAGDVTRLLPNVFDQFARGRSVIVTDAYLAVFLPPGARAELVKIMADAGQIRAVTWLSLDPLVPLGPSGRDSVQGLELPDSLIRDYQEQGVFSVLGARNFHRGRQDGRLLARAHPSGQWVEWLNLGTGRVPSR